MPEPSDTACFPWLLSVDGWGLLLVLLAVAVLSTLAAYGRGLVVLGRLVAGLLLATFAVMLAMADAPQYHFLGRWDMTGPLRPWMNPLLEPLETNGVARIEFVSVDGIVYREEAGHVGDLKGPFVSSNQYAACVAMTAPVCIGLWFWWWPRAASARDRVWRQLVVWTGAILFWIGGFLILSYQARSWAGTAAFTLASLFALGLAAPPGSRGRRISWGLGITALLVCALVFALFAGWIPTPQAWEEALQPHRRDAAHRLQAWQLAVDYIGDRPLTGIGWGNYRFNQPDQAIDCFYFAHQDYLQLAAEAGLPVLGVLLAVLLLGLRRMIRWSRAGEPRPERYIVVGACGGLMAIALHSTFDYNLRVPLNGLVAAVLLGMFLGGTRSAAFSRKAKIKGAVVALLLLLAGSVLLWRQQIRDQQLLTINRAVMNVRAAEDEVEHAAATARLGDALAAGSIDAAHTAQEAVTLGKAFLHLSGGKRKAALRDSERWFEQAVALYRREADARTLAQIRGRISVKPSPVDS